MTHQLVSSARLVLVLYLSLTILTGCSTVEMRVIDPIEPFKIDSPLAKSAVVWVTVDFQDKLNSAGREYWSWYQPDFLNDVRQALLTSGAFLNVRSSDQCKGNVGDYTVCVTAMPFNEKATVGSQIMGVIQVIFTVMLLFIPAFFSTADFSARVFAQVILLDQNGTQIGATEVSSRFEASIGAGKLGGHEGFRQAYSLNNKELAQRMVLELKRHPHWFESAR